MTKCEIRVFFGPPPTFPSLSLRPRVTARMSAKPIDWRRRGVFVSLALTSLPMPGSWPGTALRCLPTEGTVSSAAAHPTKKRLIPSPDRGAHWESSHGGREGSLPDEERRVVGEGAGCGASKDVKMCRISCFSMQGTSQEIGIKLRSAPLFPPPSSPLHPPPPPAHSSN